MRAGNRCDSVPPCISLMLLPFSFVLQASVSLHPHLYDGARNGGLSWQGLNVKIATADKVLQEGNLAFLKG